MYINLYVFLSHKKTHYILKNCKNYFLNIVKLDYARQFVCVQSYNKKTIKLLRFIRTVMNFYLIQSI